MNKAAYERVLLFIAVCNEIAAYILALLMRYVALNPLYNNPAREYGF